MKIEPFGPLQDDFRSGQICATSANVHRNPQSRHAPYNPSDFMPSLHKLMEKDKDKPVLLDDPESQSKLLKSALFKVKE